MTGTGIPDLWCAVCAEGTKSGSSVSDDLAKSNVQHAFRWASEGHYGNALQALGSLSVASFDDASAKEELRRHLHSELPSPPSSVPAPLTVQPSLVLQLYIHSKGALVDLISCLHSISLYTYINFMYQ